MKTAIAILSLMLAAGCVATEQKDPPVTCDAECQQNNNSNNNNNVDAPEIKGSFIAGHLGNYWDCPDEGYSSAGGSAGARAEGDFAPCEAGDDSCGGPLNCDGAQFTIRLTNGGLVDATDVQLSKIEIFDADGNSLATLPLIEVYNNDTNEVFDGTLAAGESLDLRVDYQGPANLSALLEDASSRISSSESALIEVTVSAGNHDDVLIDGGELFVLPSVVT